jgi:hypothetical protein
VGWKSSSFAARLCVRLLSAHFADELGQGDAGQVFSDGLLGALGHAAHDALHVAADVALLERFPFVDENHARGCDRVVDVREGNVVRPFSQPRATVLAGERLDQPGAAQREGRIPFLLIEQNGHGWIRRRNFGYKHLFRFTDIGFRATAAKIL